jgi:hypothetical protein
VAGSSSTIYADMIGVAGTITKDDSATSNAMADAKLSKELKTAGGIVSLGRAIPGIGPIFGALGGALRAGSGAVASQGTAIPSPATVFVVALSDLTGMGATPYIKSLTDGLDGATDNILSDSGKLGTIAALTLNTDSGWQFPNQISPDELQTPLVDGAARSVWLDVIPQVYGIRQFSKGPSNNPGDYGILTSEGCDSLYAGANSATYGAYFTIGSDAKNYDLYVFAEDPKASFHDKIVSTPLAQLLTMTGTYDIGGSMQDGLNFPATLLYGYSNMTYSPFQVPGGAFTPRYCGGN